MTGIPEVAAAGLRLADDLVERIPIPAPRTRTGTLAERLARAERHVGNLSARAARTRKPDARAAMAERVAGARRAADVLVVELAHARAVEDRATLTP